LTGFFNYLFFDEYATSMRVINVLKDVEDSEAAEAVSEKKTVNYLFESEVAHFGFNRTDHHIDFRMNVYLEKGNFLDIIYGENIYYQLALDAGSNLKIPYAARIEGIISRPKKRNKLKWLSQRYPDRNILEKEIYDEVGDILAARNVKVYLKNYRVTESPWAGIK